MSFQNCAYCLEPILDESLSDFCSDECEVEFERSQDVDGEPIGSHDLSDDAEALASAGFGMDEDYDHGCDAGDWFEDID